MKNIIKIIMSKKSDFFILRKNKKLMKDKILDYGKLLKEGISEYEKSGVCLIIAALFGIVVSRFIWLSVVCFIAAVYYIVQILKFTKYGAINRIITRLAKDLAYKGIYDKERIDYMVFEYKKQYGELNVEYKELMRIINSYEKFVLKLGYILKDIQIESKRARKEKELIKNYNSQFFKGLHNAIAEKKKEIEKTSNVSIVEGYKKDENTMVYSDENGVYKEAEKVVDFFNDSNDNNAVVLKNKSDNKNLTVYLYKRNCKVQDNAL